jgi:hypothetical protein
MLGGCGNSNNDCVDVNYIDFSSFYYVAVNKDQLLREPDNSLSIRNKYFLDVYEKYKILSGGKDFGYKDYRLAFKPCSRDGWAFVGTDKSISVSGSVSILADDEFDALVNEVEMLK